MRLKKLVLHGFKSFADRVEVTFEDGITGVVGPNGCGKSNIADAVRWVLGEQSAKTLRGAKMEDVIFNGTEKRRRLAFCEVTLTFDNEDKALPVDFTEVEVSRRVYRSGEGEYKLNGTPCRLRDIVDLFRDTGIGKEGYSLIGQGRIDDILSVRSEDRRKVFEEAAGIVKYKARKLDAQRRMENTRQNLTRVEDILSELETRVEPLREQSETAREYLGAARRIEAFGHQCLPRSHGALSGAPRGTARNAGNALRGRFAGGRGVKDRLRRPRGRARGTGRARTRGGRAARSRAKVDPRSRGPRGAQYR